MFREFLLIIRDILNRLLITQPDYPPGTIIISCDGSILTNPGGRCAVGVVIQAPATDWLEISEFTPSSTNNEAEFDAVYLGINTVMSMYPANLFAIQVESDSKIVVESLKKNYKLKEPRLIRKRDLILELCEHVERGVVFVWRKRNSTPGLNKANALAQSKNGVKVH